MKIQKNKVVTLSYDLRIENHESDIIESATPEMPLKFIYGVGKMIPKFEEKIEGKEKEDSFKFMLHSNEAYGEASEDNFIDIPKSSFEIDGKIDEKMLQKGNIIPLQDNQGNRFEGIVDEVKDEAVRMDFNHPMAGQDLYFTGKVLDVRDATEEELKKGELK